MQVHITARHLELTPALADYVQKKLERVARHFRIVVRSQIVLSVEKHRHIAEVVAHANGHHDFRARGVSVDLYAAIDLVVEKFHKHMARQKDKRVRERRGRKSTRTLALVPKESFQDGELNDELEEPSVSRISRFTPQMMTVSEAGAEMKKNDYAFFIFLNGDDEVNILYKRKDKSFGLLEPNLI